MGIPENMPMELPKRMPGKTFNGDTDSGLMKMLSSSMTRKRDKAMDEMIKELWNTLYALNRAMGALTTINEVDKDRKEMLSDTHCELRMARDQVWKELKSYDPSAMD